MSDSNMWARVAQRIGMLVGFGKIKASTDADAVQRSQVEVNDLETVDSLPRVAEFGFSSRPPIDSDAVILSGSGDRSNGVVIGTHHAVSRPRGLALGETVIYSELGQRIYLSANGIVVDAKAMPVTILNATNVDVTCTGQYRVTAPGGVLFDSPTVESTGDMRDNTATNGRTMAEMRSIYDGHTHAVSGVEAGGDTVQSQIPSALE